MCFIQLRFLQAMLAKLDAQVDKVSDEVLKRVLPQGVRI
jgi:hypothetical protein